MANVSAITPQLLRQLLEYDPDTGALRWLYRPATLFPDSGQGGRAGNKRRWDAQYAGRRALDAADASGRRSGTLFGKRVFAHRVAWAIHYGCWPFGDIDHIDGDPANNRIGNLREVTHGENMKNRSLQRNNASGVSGVSWNKSRQRWEAYIKVEGSRIPLGFWESREEASAARYGALKVAGFADRHGKHPSAYLPATDLNRP